MQHTHTHTHTHNTQAVLFEIWNFMSQYVTCYIYTVMLLITEQEVR